MPLPTKLLEDLASGRTERVQKAYDMLYKIASNGGCTCDAMFRCSAPWGCSTNGRFAAQIENELWTLAEQIRDPFADQPENSNDLRQWATDKLYERWPREYAATFLADIKGKGKQTEYSKGKGKRDQPASAHR